MVNNTDFLMLNNPWNKLCLVSMDFCFPLDFVSNLFWIFASKFIIILKGQVGRLRRKDHLDPVSKIIINKRTSLLTVSPSNERAYLPPVSFADLAHVFYLSYFSINAKSNSFSLDIIIALGMPHNKYRNIFIITIVSFFCGYCNHFSQPFNP
uniref:Transmembrane protein n=1 Tax=Colobus angolensis palliatus TaxID=336983 RepID=A0A2K5IRE5_COLAP